jgi:hypothetical protein
LEHFSDEGGGDFFQRIFVIKKIIRKKQMDGYENSGGG